MKLQTDPEKKPERISFKENVMLATKVADLLEAAGMTDKSSDGFQLEESLSHQVSRVLRTPFKETRRYLYNLSKVPAQARGTLFRAAIRLAASKYELRYGRVPTVSGHLGTPHWAGAYTVNLGFWFDPEVKRKKLLVKFLIISGEIAGQVLLSNFSSGFLSVMKMEIGAGLRGKDTKLPNAYVLANLRFCYSAVFLESRRDITVAKISATQSMKTYNRHLVRSRFRELSACPFNALHDCCECNATTLNCPRAVEMG